ncbi:MAG: ABC transporter permease [Lachnospiraceae bacterium]|nr:ABC transporter permease [Lachnospiraceae bacterium]
MELIKAIINIYTTRGSWFLSLLIEHIRLTATAILIAGVLGLIIGILISERQKLATIVIGICNVCYTVPSIALFGLLIPFSGIGNKTAVIALSIYALMPMVRNTYAGITSIDTDIIEAARGMGSTNPQIMVRIKLPLAYGLILTGLRQMTVMTISMGGIASFVGAGGLGVAIYRGITIFNPAMTFAGGLLIALLAVVSDNLLGLLEKQYKRKRRMT